MQRPRTHQSRCPSQGGGKYLQYAKGGGGKGCGMGDRQGDGGSPSNYFHGRGSGLASICEETYTAAQWESWMQQGAGGAAQKQAHEAAVAPAALQAPSGQPGEAAAPWMTGVASPGLQSMQPYRFDGYVDDRNQDRRQAWRRYCEGEDHAGLGSLAGMDNIFFGRHYST